MSARELAARRSFRSSLYPLSALQSTSASDAEGKGVAKGKLARYRAKRDFKSTTEPTGKRAVARSSRLRFVIQKHAARRLHYDLRLELDGVFKSWAVTKRPSLDPKVKRLAVEVEDHPLDYGDFEGTIPQGQYGGGTVQLWDRGYWRPDGSTSAVRMLSDGDLKFELEGVRLKGAWVLIRMRGDSKVGKHPNWLLIKRHDAYEEEREPAAEVRQRSVASGRTLAEIAAGKGGRPQPFMLASNRTSGRARSAAIGSEGRGSARGRTARSRS
jgi:bifunctional non-homologous end joining protein LigD